MIQTPSPTVELVLYLQGQLGEAATVSTDMVGWTENTPWVRLSRSGGNYTGASSAVGWVKTPRFNVDVYANGTDASELLALAVNDALFRINTERQSWTSYVFTAANVDDPAYVADPVDSVSAHYNFLAQLTGHPAR